MFLQKWVLLLVQSCLIFTQTNVSAEILTHHHSQSVYSNTSRIDPEGISSIIQKSSRTPSGSLYKSPNLSETGIKLDENWLLLGSLEFGYLANDGDENAAEFNDFQDWNDGPLINSFELSTWNKQLGYFVNTYGGSVGRDDQSYHLSAGQYGKFKINSFYNQIPHSYSQNAVTLFNGVGTEHLTLPLGLEPGNNSNEQIQQALESASPAGLGLNRKQAGIEVEFTPWKGIKLFADFKHRKREGKRAFGGSFFPPFYAGGNAGGVVETIEPIDYSTNEVSSGISYSDTGLQLNIKYNGSFFVNEKNQLSYDNPFTNLPGSEFIIEQGRIDLYPDNNFHQILADFSYQLPMQGQLFSTVSWSRMQQDDALIAPTVNSGVNFNGISLDQWNSLNALPRKTAEAEIDNLLLQMGVQLVPINSLTLRAKFRFQEEDNKTDYTAFNPLTDQFGYIGLDGSNGGAVFNPETTQLPIHYRSIPFAKTTIKSTFDADYRVTRKTKLGIAYQHQQIKYNHRERDKTDENQIKIYLSSRTLSWATLRLSYQYADRDGDSYDFNPYDAFYTSSLAGFQSVLEQGSTPHTLADLRKFDLSNRQQNQLSAQANFLLTDDMDLSISSKWEKNDYDANYGLQDEQNASVNLEWSYQPTANFNSYVFYSYQHRTSDLANINDVGFSADPNAGGNTFPLSAAWSQSTKDNNHFIGLGLRYAFSRFDIATNYSYNWSKNIIEYQTAVESDNSLLAQQQTNYPDIQFNRHILQTNVRWHVQKNLSLRFYHRYEQGSTEDWHFQGLTPLIGNHLFLNATPEDYNVHLFGVFVQYTL